MDVVEVFAEITCPFTHVGLRRLVAERDRRDRAIPRFRVRAWPLELVNGAPLDGASVAEKAQALREQVAPELFAGIDPGNWPSTSRPALALVAAAYRFDVEAGELVSIALRDALFERGENIADPAVLTAIAEWHDIGPVSQADRDSVDGDWHEGQRRGVIGSPHFFFGDSDAFCPTLSITKPDGQLKIELDRPAFDGFIATVFD